MPAQQEGALNSESWRFLWWLSQGYCALQCCTQPCQSKGQTLPVPRGINATSTTVSLPTQLGKAYPDI